jgi:hypothetical protein
MRVEVEVIGWPLVDAELDRIIERSLDPSGASDKVFRDVEQDMLAEYGSLGGRYVLTGASKTALTTSGGNAIREIVSSDEFDFGSGVPYDIYAGYGVPRGLWEAVDADKVGRTVLDYIVGEA